MDSRFGSLEGVWRTRVGYAGGAKKNPTYHDLGNHTETLELDFDPKTIEYDELLRHFWKGHNPFSRSWSRQYMSAIFYGDQNQLAMAKESMAREEKRSGKKIHTRILPAEMFYLAETYHQKYILKQDSFFIRQIRRMYPNEEAITGSTVAARLNGYLGGNGTLALLEKELEAYGLTDEARNKLRELVAKRG